MILSVWKQNIKMKVSRCEHILFYIINVCENEMLNNNKFVNARWTLLILSFF